MRCGESRHGRGGRRGEGLMAVTCAKSSSTFDENSNSNQSVQTNNSCSEESSTERHSLEPVDGPEHAEHCQVRPVGGVTAAKGAAG